MTLIQGKPTPQPNAHVLDGDTIIGSDRQYNCNDQYALNDGSDPSTMTVICQPSGDWTSTNFHETSMRDFMKSRPPENQADIIEAFNSTSRYLDDLLNIDNIYFA